VAFFLPWRWSGVATLAPLPYNRGMTQLELLLPFAMPPAEMARDLLRELNMPVLATLLARGRRNAHQLSDGFSRTLPHEKWLAQRFGWTTQDDADTSPSVAGNAMQHYGLKAEAGTWFILQPVHLHIARDHLVLTDLRQLHLSEADSRALFNIALPLCEELGKTLQYGDAQTWFMRADEWTLNTSTPDAACGHNIDIWMPKGQHERDWRRLQNEIQMNWHDHAINEQREASGLKAINSLWLWGGTSSASNPAASTATEIEETFIFTGARKPFDSAIARQISVSSAMDVIAARPQHGLLVLDQLTEAALAGDWAEWLMRFQALESAWFAPLLDALKNSQLDRFNLTISHNTACSTYTVDKSSLRKFWCKAALTRLVA
jgi:hypothetical protein